jgi:cell division protein FtsB
MGWAISIIIPLAVIAIPLTAIVLSYRQKTQKNRIREMELQKEILTLEIEKQNGTIELLERENRKLDRIINGAPPSRRG